MPLPLHLHAMPFPLRYTSLTIIRGKRHRLPPWSQLFIEGWVSTLGALGLRFDALARGPSRNETWRSNGISIKTQTPNIFRRDIYTNPALSL